MSTDSESRASALSDLMQAHGLTGDTRLYRAQLPEFLAEAGEDGVFLASGNPDASEAVIDIYGGGHMAVADSLGVGLAFTESRENQWEEEDRVGVEIRLGDVLDQGGLIYPVESVITEKVWYLTLPTGSVRVRRLP